jgi:RNA polymerase sigma-70 factor (ECF subfamily)
MTDETPAGLDEFAMRLVRCTARQLVGRSGFTASDREDIEQDLALDLLAHLPHFDPRRANAEAFVTHIVRNAVRTLLRRRCAERRDWRRCRASLDDEITADDGALLGLCETLLAEAFLRRTGRCDESDPGRQDLRIDVADAVADLPPALRRIAERLAHSNPTDVSRAEGIGRDAVYRAIHQIRARFAAVGLLAYSDRADSSRSRCVGSPWDGTRTA